MSEPPPNPSATAPPTPEDPDLLKTVRNRGPGSMVFNRFRLVRELGAGGMAVVWLANDERLGLEVALKFLPGMVAKDPEALHDLRREITRCLKLTHEGIVRVYDLHEDAPEGVAAIAMEYIDGSTLADEKAKQPDRCFDVEEPLIGWVAQICEVLAYVHEKKVVHRDLKPRNIMVTKEGRIKIADFGIAATLCDSQSRLTQHPGSSGTPVYMSPQQAMAHHPTQADDIYSFGATLYELLTSKPPFFRGSMAVILNAVASQVPPSINDRRKELGLQGHANTSPDWETTVRACLEKEPRDRPASSRELLQSLIGTHLIYAEVDSRLASSHKSPLPEPASHGDVIAESQCPSGSVATIPLTTAPRTSGRRIVLKLFVTVAAVTAFIGIALYYWHEGSNTLGGSIVSAGDTSAYQKAPDATVTVRTDTPEKGRKIKEAGSPEIANVRPTPLANMATPDPVVSATLAPRPSTPQPAAPPEGFTAEIPLTLPTPAPPPAVPMLAYSGIVRCTDDVKYSVPLTIRFDASLLAGTMAQSTAVGDTVVLFTGIWKSREFVAHTTDLVSKPARVIWDEEEFTLQFNGGRAASYACRARGRTYHADLQAP